MFLTCNDSQSRNKKFGVLLAQNNNIRNICTKIRQTIEGIYTTHVIYSLSQKYILKMPIITSLYNVIYRHY